MRAAAIAMLALASCVPNSYTISIAGLRDAQPELAAGRTAQVPSTGGPLAIRDDDLVGLRTPDGVLHQVPVSAVLADPRGMNEVTLVRGRRVAPGGKRAAWNTGAAAVLGGMIYCTLECGSPGNWIAGGTLLTSTLLTAVILVEVLRR